MTRTSSTRDATHELVIKRTFDAPRELVWRAWNDAEHAKQWGPKGFTTPVREMDLRPGGAWRALMIAPDGTQYRQHGIVREVMAPERLAFTFIWDDDPAVEMLIAVTFTERDGKTDMIFRQTGLPSADSRDGHRGGWTEAFDRLAEVIRAM
ncbi:MAG TPA: SRPBCC domain-containing protein [Gemmatimonadales bacterium]|nr:SRPBCC domain-containing protein [Gemmatimonadales bacterium]